MRYPLAILLLLAATAASAETVEQALATAPAGTRIGLLVVDEDGREVVAIRADERFVPASNTKLFTTAAAVVNLDTAAPDAAGGASVRLDGGDVILSGHGDARLSAAADCTVDCLAELARAIAARTRTVRDVIGDDTFLPDERWPAGMSWNNMAGRYGTAISALTIDDNVVTLTVTPGAAGAPAAVAGVVTALAPAGAVSARAIAAYGGGFGEAFERVKEDWATVTDLQSATERGGYLERYLKLSFWASMIVGGSFAFSPLSPLAIVNEYTPSSQFIQRAFGLGTVFMLAPAQFVLLDACRRGRLGGGTFKKLNLAVAAAIAGIDAMTVYTFAAAQALSPDAAVLADASGGIYNYVGALAVSFSIFGVYLYQGIFARK